jgi:hypothetical protein
MATEIFFSWQSDLPASANRNFLLEALQRAANDVGKEGHETIVDRDTHGVPGSPDVVATIFEKIDHCDGFVADVTPIGTAGPQERSTLNPNVAIEIGRASSKPGWGQMILVLNTFYAEPRDLPFDLVTRRVLLYKLDPAQEVKAETRKLVQSKFVAALRSIIEMRLDGVSQALAEGEVLIQPAAPSEISSALSEAALAQRAFLSLNALAREFSATATAILRARKINLVDIDAWYAEYAKLLDPVATYVDLYLPLAQVHLRQLGGAMNLVWGHFRSLRHFDESRPDDVALQQRSLNEVVSAGESVNSSAFELRRSIRQLRERKVGSST